MVNWPVRKCYHTFKLVTCLIIIVTVFTLFEHWRGGKRNSLAYTGIDAEYESQILADEALIIPGLGDGGAAVYLDGEEKKLGELSEKKLAMNVYLSDRIPYNRTLKDYRHPACSRVVYDAELPSVSVIIIFHNEPYSVVIRTIWNVINTARRDQPWHKLANYIDHETGKRMSLGYPGQDPSSPLVYLKEIILVDDNSTLPELKGKLSHYVRTRLPPNLIRILRLPDRQGLMTARMSGARLARGGVLVFLDAHCEGSSDWLRPLLQRIRNKRDAVVTPLIDVVDQTTFELEASENFQVGGFTFTGHFTWIDVPEREKIRRGSDIAPTWSPTMAGGLFAIDRKYYWELGAYDEQMAGWGGENLELSFRIWQCGGTLETIPCSRVGHVFRKFHPYGLPAKSDTHGINTARMADVWMDEYAELFYLHRPDLRKSPKIGDVTHRKVLREKLHCKNFQWFLDNIYKEKFVPVRDAFGYGRFKNDKTNYCLDTMMREAEGSVLGVYPCHDNLAQTQYLTLALSGELRDEEKCAEVNHYNRDNDNENSGQHVVLVTCRANTRQLKWKYVPDSRQIQHVESGLCLEATMQVGGDVWVKDCDHNQLLQKWTIDYSELNGFRRESSLEMDDQQEILQKIRQGRRSPSQAESRSRRISRSLLSYPGEGGGAESSEKESRRHALRSLLSALGEGGAQSAERAPRRHSHSHKNKKKKSKRRKPTKRSRKTKNKFILKLVRTFMNDTEDHLEVDIHCKHKKLYSNNTFVRDLVTILNEKNIKVINNGRVFERNKVTDLTKYEDLLRKEKNKLRMLGSKDEEKKDNLNAAVAGIEKSTKSGDVDENKNSSSVQGVNPDHYMTPSKKIIIEDFVAVKPVKPVRGSMMKEGRQKHKKIRPSTLASLPLDGDADGNSPMSELPRRQQPQTVENEKLLPTGHLIISSLEDPTTMSHERNNEEVEKNYPEKKEKDNNNDVDNTERQKEKEVDKNENDLNEDTNNKDDIEIMEAKKDRMKFLKRDKKRKLDYPKKYDADAESDVYVEKKQKKSKSGNKLNSPNKTREFKKVKYAHKEDYYLTDVDEGKREREVKDGEIEQVKEREKLQEHKQVAGDKTVRNGKKSKENGKGRWSMREFLHKGKARDYPRVKKKNRTVQEIEEEITGGDYVDKRERKKSFRARSHADDPPLQMQFENEIPVNTSSFESGAGLRTQESPLKVVMRSNLTFNLGDEFFDWKRSKNDEVADLLEELEIPINNSGVPPLEAWVMPEDQAFVKNTREAVKPTSSDESSSSDNSSGE